MIRRRHSIIAAMALGLAAAGSVWSAVTDGQTTQTSSSRDGVSSRATVAGTVKSLVKNDRDDVDGFLLENGETIHFPPHMSKEVLSLAGQGHQVVATGENKTTPQGQIVFEAQTIEREGRKVTMAPPSKPKPGSHERKNDSPMQAKGKVREMHVNRHGDVDGFIMADDTEVKFPPHQSQALSDAVKAGSHVSVEGRRHVTPKGDVHLHADRIANTSSGASVERDEPADGPRPPHEVGPRAQHGEILEELRAIRRLLERQTAKPE